MALFVITSQIGEYSPEINKFTDYDEAEAFILKVDGSTDVMIEAVIDGHEMPFKIVKQAPIISWGVALGA